MPDMTIVAPTGPAIQDTGLCPAGSQVIGREGANPATFLLRRLDHLPDGVQSALQKNWETLSA